MSSADPLGLTRDYSAALPTTMDEAAQKQLRDQKEMQLLERRVREANAAAASAASAASRNAAAAAGGGVAGPASLLGLHKERLKQYSELAARAEEDTPRDTIDDAEYVRAFCCCCCCYCCCCCC